MADRKPHPPKSKGRLATSCLSVVEGKPNKPIQHLHVAASCAAANSETSVGGTPPQRICCPCVGTEQEQEPSALQILQTLNSLEEGSVFLGGCAELGLHEINVTDGNTENTDSLLLGQSIASPDTCVRINAFCPGELVTVRLRGRWAAVARGAPTEVTALLSVMPLPTVLLSLIRC